VTETASDEMAMGAVRAFCQFSLLVRQQSQWDLSLKSLDNELKRLYEKRVIFREQTTLKFVKAKVDDLSAQESHPLHKPKLQKIHTSMDAVVYAAETDYTTKGRQFQVRLNRA
jgi:hypothetical protein